MFDYKISKHPHFDEACRAFALRHNLVQLAERAGMNVQILRNKLNPAQPHLLTAPEIWLLTDLTEDSTLVDGFLAQIHCLPCVPINEVAKEKLPHYVMSATAEIGRVAAGAVSGLRAVAVMFMNPLAVLRGGLAAAGTVLRVLASGPLAMLRVALYAISGLLGALLSPIGLVVTALAGVALVVWKYWQPITAFLGGVVEGFKAAAGPISAAFEPLKPVFQWIGDKVQALWGWFTDLLTPVKSTSAELQSAAAMGRRFGEALAEGLNMVMHPLDSLKSGVSWLLEKLGIVSKEAAKAKLPESVTRQQPATVNADGKVMMPSGGFPSWGYGFAGMYDSGGYIPRGQFGIVGENGPEIVNGPANVTSRRNTAALAAVVAGMMGVAAAPAELPPLHPLALPAKGGEAIVSRAATVPLVQRIEAPTQIIIQTQPGQSAQDIAREVARQLDERERRLKAKARSNYSDQGGYDA
ncbi:phage regulatory CII family protein [Escherichia coli]|nr:phage regulatory CII family protein [Escherichia coli]AUO39385.1 tolA [Escherichia coli]EFN8318212.1 tolA [Escherichia coli]EFP0185395.1 tolA [Escherichia coli]MDY8201565.1 phage regulatory CII family protein [Escherichia coli]MDY8671650.1 phage regulatory CII family protein [Escherichia coli]